MQKKNIYTLIELVTVIVVMGLISAVAIVQFRKLPAFISLESKVNEFIKVLAQARNNAACLGVNTEIAFDAENRRIFIAKEDDGEQKTSSAEMSLPEEIKLSQSNEEIDRDSGKTLTLFKFYPDGTGDGNKVCLELKKHKFQIRVSPLSGAIHAEEIDE